MFKVIETYEEAVPLSEAGLLWYQIGDQGMRPDVRGYWIPRDMDEWDEERDEGIYYYVYIEE